MSSILKGNFTPKKDVKVTATSDKTESLDEAFEREAVKRLGGSIAFVAKKKIDWDLKE
ncbi:hypothetical protein [Magnetospirillum gryphiswaldense]|uniref:Uncharacterized protein n=1 Tax=Magnetospirillum gryphiswaldense TaxID=55518 RepID=A4U180_9PROT|nr:hypothetical protein [Magnetospirillum gryphiswaldense]AVM75582.1 hypothetical protein MSR1_31160 [Magnetospirillum gryphiswaldense MSR-1]AVM79485.1 hypothetical protein MSR1L_31160 [Magnetospirillum gryphiswaldense]CAM76637.1 hypothetical protein MGR_1167 [Magnetospirillum gryphiswaldense MSR-1]